MTAAQRQASYQRAARARGDCGQCLRRPASDGRFRCEHCETKRSKRVYGPLKPLHMRGWYVRGLAKRQAETAARKEVRDAKARLVKVGISPIASTFLADAARRMGTTQSELLESLILAAPALRTKRAA